MTTQRFKDILRNLHFSDNTKSDKNDNGFEIRPVIDHFKNSFSDTVSNDELQSVDKHMVKFKGRSSMKQYVKKKNQVGLQILVSLCKYDKLLVPARTLFREERKVELNLGESFVSKMCKALEKCYCIVYFDNFFNSPLLISKLFKKRIYGVGTAQSNRRGMPALPSDKEMKRGDSDYQFSTDVGCCKWMDNRSVVMLCSNIEGMQTKSSIQRRAKGSGIKVSISYPDVIKFYNKDMCEVDLVDQRNTAYHLD